LYTEDSDLATVLVPNVLFPSQLLSGGGGKHSEEIRRARYEWRNATTNKSVMIITGHAILTF
jgi:hypothetical protein